MFPQPSASAMEDVLASRRSITEMELQMPIQELRQYCVKPYNMENTCEAILYRTRVRKRHRRAHAIENTHKDEKTVENTQTRMKTHTEENSVEVTHSKTQ